jgi:hypothetical protein
MTIGLEELKELSKKLQTILNSDQSKLTSNYLNNFTIKIITYGKKNNCKSKR